MWNRIEMDVLEKYMSQPVDTYEYQDFWKNILADYSADYWKLARKMPYKVDTIGYQLIGSIVDNISDIWNINAVAFNYEDEETSIKIMYSSPFGYFVYIPISWFEDRDTHLRNWVKKAEDEYIDILQKDIDLLKDRIQKQTLELDKTRGLDIVDFVFGGDVMIG